MGGLGFGINLVLALISIQLYLSISYNIISAKWMDVPEFNLLSIMMMTVMLLLMGIAMEWDRTNAPAAAEMKMRMAGYTLE